MQEPVASPSPSRPDGGAATFGLIIGTLISFGISKTSDDFFWKPVLVTLGPAIGISLTLAWSAVKLTIIRFFQEEQELAEIQRAQLHLAQRIGQETDPERRALLEAELAITRHEETDLVLRRLRRRRRERQNRQ